MKIKLKELDKTEADKANVSLISRNMAKTKEKEQERRRVDLNLIANHFRKNGWTDNTIIFWRMPHKKPGVFGVKSPRYFLAEYDGIAYNDFVKQMESILAEI